MQKDHKGRKDYKKHLSEEIPPLVPGRRPIHRMRYYVDRWRLTKGNLLLHFKGSQKQSAMRRVTRKYEAVLTDARGKK